MSRFTCLLLVVFWAPAALAASAQVDTTNYSGAAWSPYLAGAGIGLLLCLTMYFSRKPVGASSAYATLAGFIGQLAAPARTRRLKYYQDNPPAIDWEFVFVAATILGAFAAAATGRELTAEWLHPIWVEKFGESSFWLRGIVGFAGGALMAFGARMAKGCTSGHGISGAAQLNAGSWLALLCFFAGGALVANLLFKL